MAWPVSTARATRYMSKLVGPNAVQKLLRFAGAGSEGFGLSEAFVCGPGVALADGCDGCDEQKCAA